MRSSQSTPGFFWLVTEGNDRTTQVNAGRAYARVQLAATAHGLSMQPLSAGAAGVSRAGRGPTRRSMRLLRGAAAALTTVQMWARLGYAPPVGPRRAAACTRHVLAA